MDEFSMLLTPYSVVAGLGNSRPVSIRLMQ
jgi:hypothetical protein